MLNLLGTVHLYDLPPKYFPRHLYRSWQKHALKLFDSGVVCCVKALKEIKENQERACTIGRHDTMYVCRQTHKFLS